MEATEHNTERIRGERKAKLLIEEQELILSIELIDRNIVQVQFELGKVHAAHYAIPRASFSSQKPKIAEGSVIMGAVRRRIEEEEKREDQYHTTQTDQYREIRDDVLETTRQIDRDIAAAGEDENLTTPQDQMVSAGQLQTDAGIHAANILVTIKRDSLIRKKKELEEELSLTRKSLEILNENTEAGGN